MTSTVNVSSNSIPTLPSPGKKTLAFFSSPWPSRAPSPPPQLQPATTSSSPKVSKTSLFFSTNTSSVAPTNDVFDNTPHSTPRPPPVRVPVIFSPLPSTPTPPPAILKTPIPSSALSPPSSSPYHPQQLSSHPSPLPDINRGRDVLSPFTPGLTGAGSNVGGSTITTNTTPAPILEEPKEGTIISSDSLWPPLTESTSSTPDTCSPSPGYTPVQTPAPTPTPRGEERERELYNPHPPARPRSPLHQHHFPSSPPSERSSSGSSTSSHLHPVNHHHPHYANSHHHHSHSRSSNHRSSNTTLRLLRPLGHGAFSSVWLAEDLSPLPLVLRSRRSLRDLRRKASFRLRERSRSKGRNGESRRGETADDGKAKCKLDKSLSLSLGRAESLKKLRDRVPGVRPIVQVHPPSSGPGTRLPIPNFMLPANGKAHGMPNPHSPAKSTTEAEHDDGQLSRASSVSSTASSIASISSFNSTNSVGSMGTAETALTGSTSPLSMKGIGLGISPGKGGLEVPDALRPGGRRRGSHSSTTSTGKKKELRIFVEEPEEVPAPSREGKRERTISLMSTLSTTSSDGGSAGGKTPRGGRMVAVKMTVRSGAYLHQGKTGGLGREEAEREMERTRVAFVREVEVLRHISHPSITPLLSFLSTPTHHLLVLPYLPGGDLLSLVNSDTAWERLRESVVKRIWSELVGAVGWMHSVGIVHRDVKLENILLTTSLFNTLTSTSPSPTLAELPEDPLPIIKLTDFGLSRFVDIRTPDERKRDRIEKRRRERRKREGKSPSIDLKSSAGEAPTAEEEEEDQGDVEGEGPWLTTRCGSEAYAAPELIMAPSSSFVSPTNRKGQVEEVRPAGAYDGRETDSWACGVVLYALVTRKLPFGEGPAIAGAGGKIGREGEGSARMSPLQMRSARRAWLMKIASGQYDWPDAPLPSPHAGGAPNAAAVVEHPWEADEELMGPRLVESEGAKRIVGKLLVRDPRRRARAGSLWSDVWMGGSGEEDDEARNAADDEDNESMQGDDGHCEDMDEDELMHELGDEGVVEGLLGMDDLSVEEELRLMEQLEDEIDSVSAAATDASTDQQGDRPYHKHRHLVQDWVDMLEEGGYHHLHQHPSLIGDGEGGTVSRGGSQKSLKGKTRGWLVEEDNIDDVARREVV